MNILWDNRNIITHCAFIPNLIEITVLIVFSFCQKHWNSAETSKDKLFLVMKIDIMIRKRDLFSFLRKNLIYTCKHCTIENLNWCQSNDLTLNKKIIVFRFTMWIIQDIDQKTFFSNNNIYFLYYAFIIM